MEDFDGETLTGTVKVKVGPITVTYRGTAAFQERDEAARRIVLAAGGKEVRGQGTARATVTGTLVERDGGTTAVSVATDLSVTGRPAQFGRGVMAEVGDKIIGQFADCLSDELARAAQPAAAEPAAQPAVEPQPIDLIRTAGIPVAKRAAGVLAVVLPAALIAILLRRRLRGGRWRAATGRARTVAVVGHARR